jgi:hypothetical protein
MRNQCPRRRNNDWKGRTMNRLIASACFATWSMTLAGGPAGAQTSNFNVIATGLDGPRGLKFGPDGNLYVAEAGVGGTTTTVGMCTQVASPVGPYHGGKTARISMIHPDGTRTTVVDQLPSTMSSLPTGDTQGVADVTFLNGDLYALVSGGGCSHGNPDVPASVIKVDRDAGTWQVIADLSQFVMTHPAKTVDAADFEPDESFYSMIVVGQKLYVVGPNHGQVIEVKPNGQISQLIDISASQGHVVPTSVVFHDGAFRVGNLNTFPIQPGSSEVFEISRKGEIVASTAGFTTIVGLSYRHDRLYALEFSADLGFPAPGAGKVVRLTKSGSVEDVVTGLTLPSGMTFGPDGNLYVTNFGATPPGTGEVVQIPLGSFE